MATGQHPNSDRLPAISDAEQGAAQRIWLPTFAGIAALRIADAGPRDKTINIKVAINTARMMVEAETEILAELTAALQDLLSDCEEYARINNLHNSDGSPATHHAMRRAAAAIALAGSIEAPKLVAHGNHGLQADAVKP